MSTLWANLPNAASIDRILDHLREHPNQWTNTQEPLYSNWSAAFRVACGAEDPVSINLRLATSRAARNSVHERFDQQMINLHQNSNVPKYQSVEGYQQTQTSNYITATYAIMALLAWPGCEYLLDCEPDHVNLLASLGNQAAILLHPTIVVLNKI